jgi:hypothetical protein
MIQKKRILIRADFCATFPMQIIFMSLGNTWMIGMIINGRKKSWKWSVERKREFGRNGLR